MAGGNPNEIYLEDARFEGAGNGDGDDDFFRELSFSDELDIGDHFEWEILEGGGNITPQGDPARTLAILEALVGQLFVGILIARLVALQIAGAGDSS